MSSAASGCWVRRNALRIYAGLAVLYMLLPIVVIAVFSFAATPKDKLNFASTTASRSSTGNAFAPRAAQRRYPNLDELAALATLISTAIGTLMAWPSSATASSASASPT